MCVCVLLYVATLELQYARQHFHISNNCVVTMHYRDFESNMTADVEYNMCIEAHMSQVCRLVLWSGQERGGINMLCHTTCFIA